MKLSTCLGYSIKFVAIILIIPSCQHKDAIVNDNSIFQKAKPSDSLKFYFPDSLNRPSIRNSKYNNFEQNWYSSSLYSFKEPVLKDKINNETIYRFLWLRSFNQTVCYSVKKFKDKYFLNTKTLDRSPNWYQEINLNIVDGKEVYDTSKADRLAYIVFNETLEISKKEWNKFKSLLEESNFWNLASIDRSDDSTDGSNWVFEGVENNRYHFVVRHNAHELEASGTYLIKLSNLKIPTSDIY